MNQGHGEGSAGGPPRPNGILLGHEHRRPALASTRRVLDKPVRANGVKILPPADVMDTLKAVNAKVGAVVLDPWYNRGVGGERDDYDEWLKTVVAMSFEIAEHVFVWGFPDIVRNVLDGLPSGVKLTAWLTWYYKNCPTIIRGWRSAQYTCLHLSKNGAAVYPENFMNDEQRQRFYSGKMRFVPGPPTVIEAPLNIGFVGKGEQTGHPAQKPVSTIAPLVKISTRAGETVLDPMCGAGTTGVACSELGRKAILCDLSAEYTEIAVRRLRSRGR